MISRPTTDQILDDCARELREVLMPAIVDPGLRVQLEMMEQLLRSCGIRAANEIAWMAEESALMEEFVSDLTSQHPDATEAAALLDAARRDRSDSLFLANQVANYDRAGRAFSAALAYAIENGDTTAAEAARQMVLDRISHERSARPDFYFPGRT